MEATWCVTQASVHRLAAYRASATDAATLHAKARSIAPADTTPRTPVLTPYLTGRPVIASPVPTLLAAAPERAPINVARRAPLLTPRPTA